MRNGRVTRQRLTQGQPAATMTLTQPRLAFRAGEQAAQEQGPGALPALETPAASGVDVYALARRVYDLMQQDLRIERQRRGQWPW